MGLSSQLTCQEKLGFSLHKTGLRFPNINIIPLVERKDVSFILTIFSGTNDTSFESPNIGRLESEVYNFFLTQLTSKLQAIESGSPKKVPRKGAFYYINHHNSGNFLDLQIQQLALLKPVDVGKSYIPQKKALYPVVLKKF